MHGQYMNGEIIPATKLTNIQYLSCHFNKVLRITSYSIKNSLSHQFNELNVLHTVNIIRNTQKKLLLFLI